MLEKDDRIDTLSVRDGKRAVQVDGVVLVNRYRPDLETRLADEAGDRLGRLVKANLVQLRQQSNSALELEDQVNRRLSALETRDAESSQLLAELTASGLIERDTITMDAQARRLMIAWAPGDPEDKLGQAIGRILETVRTRHPNWLIETVEPADQ